MDDYLIKEYLDNSKDKEISKVKLLSRRIVSKLLLSIIFLLVSIILINKSTRVKEFYLDNIYTNSWSFTKFNSLYNKYLNKESCKVFGLVIREDMLPEKLRKHIIEEYPLKLTKSHFQYYAAKKNIEYLYIFRKENS